MQTTASKKKPIVAIVAVLLVLLIVTALLYIINPRGIFSGIKPSMQPAVVTITGNGFSPETVRIKKGQAVEWVNADGSQHQIAADPFPDHSSLPSLYIESPLNKDESFSYTFDDAGTYTYHDQLQPAKFTGTVIVE